MINFEKVFNSFTAPGAFNLVDSTHPIEFYIGIDDRGRKSVILRSKFRPDTVKATSAIEISVGQVKNNVWSLGFHLIQNSMSGLFYKFCDDIIESSRNLPDSVNGMSYVVKRYNSWKKMFYKLKKDILSENEIIGLIGELIFLRKEMMKKYSEEVAVNSWSGCDKTHKDFSVEKDWYEIKSTKDSTLTIRIHSLEQLDADTEGQLVLFEFEKMSETFDGYSLNNVVRDVLNDLTPEVADILLEKLKSVGWEYNDEYDKFVYRITSYTKFLVDEKFPRLKKADIPTSIVKIEYDILKNDLLALKVVE